MSPAASRQAFRLLSFESLTRRSKRMRRCFALVAIAVACFHANAARADTTTPPRPARIEERRIDPVVGKAIVEKSGFFAAAIVLAILFEKFT